MARLKVAGAAVPGAPGAGRHPPLNSSRRARGVTRRTITGPTPPSRRVNAAATSSRPSARDNADWGFHLTGATQVSGTPAPAVQTASFDP